MNNNMPSRMRARATESSDATKNRNHNKTSSILQSSGDYNISDIYNSIQAKPNDSKHIFKAKQRSLSKVLKA